MAALVKRGHRCIERAHDQAIWAVPIQQTILRAVSTDCASIHCTFLFVLARTACHLQVRADFPQLLEERSRDLVDKV